MNTLDTKPVTCRVPYCGRILIPTRHGTIPFHFLPNTRTWCQNSDTRAPMHANL
jgi:hypothetical protein